MLVTLNNAQTKVSRPVIGMPSTVSQRTKLNNTTTLFSGVSVCAGGWLCSGWQDRKLTNYFFCFFSKMQPFTENLSSEYCPHYEAKTHPPAEALQMLNQAWAICSFTDKCLSLPSTYPGIWHQSCGFRTLFMVIMLWSFLMIVPPCEKLEYILDFGFKCKTLKSSQN